MTDKEILDWLQQHATYIEHTDSPSAFWKDAAGNPVLLKDGFYPEDTDDLEERPATLREHVEEFVRRGVK